MNNDVKGIKIGDMVELIDEPRVKGIVYGLVMYSVIEDSNDPVTEEEDSVFVHIKIIVDPVGSCEGLINNTSVLNVRKV